MGEHQESGEVDLGKVMRRVSRRWPIVLGFAVMGAVAGGIITGVLAPVYQAKASLVFPAGNRGPALQSLGLGSVVGSENMELVEGIVTSREVEDAVTAEFSIDREVFRENMIVQQLPGRRQVVLTYQSPEKEEGLNVLKNVLSHLARLEESIGVNSSERRLLGYQEAFNEKDASVRAIEKDILEFQKRAKTVPSSDDGFTGMAYLKGRSETKRELNAIEREIEAKKSSAAALGQAATSGLPTGLERETKWRDALIEASIEFDRAQAKYQPGTPQLRTAAEKLETTRSNLIKEIKKHVSSVESGADNEMAELLAKKTVAQWQYSRAEDLAEVAPVEAAEYRDLIERLTSETAARAELRTQSDGEVVRNKVEAKIWQVLDEPYVEEEPVNKKFGMNIGLGLILGGLAGGLFSNRSGQR